MALFHITIEKVIVKQDDALLKEIRDLLKGLGNDPEAIKESVDKLKAARENLNKSVDENKPV